MNYDYTEDEKSPKKCRATGKVSFSSFVEARLTIFKLRWNFRHPVKKNDGTRMKRLIKKKPRQQRVYYCCYCKGYHLTKYKFVKYTDFIENANDIE